MSAPTQTPARPPRPAAGFGPARMMAMGQPGEKPLNFKASSRRLLTMLRPDRGLLAVVLASGIASVALSVTGPRVLGHATDIIFAGVIGSRLPAGASKAQVIAGLRARGQNQIADLLQGVNVVPGHGIDFTALGHVLLWVLGIYLLATVFGILQFRLTTTLVQRSLFRLRRDVEAKLSRLPLSYFDGQPRGEVLSRATNDADNIAQTLQ